MIKLIKTGKKRRKIIDNRYPEGRLPLYSMVALILNIEGMGGPNLLEYLKEKKYLKKDKTPYREHIENGLFKVLPMTRVYSDGDEETVLVTGFLEKGIVLIRDRLISEGYKPYREDSRCIYRIKRP